MRGPSYNGILSQQPPYGCQVSVILSQMDAVCADVQGNFRIIVDDEKTAVFTAQGGKLAPHIFNVFRVMVFCP